MPAQVKMAGQGVVASSAATSVAVRSHTPAGASRIAAVDYLRGFSIVLVVAIHSAAGYAVVIPASHPHHSWLAGAPVADSHRLVGTDQFLHFNDIFLMSLMFFVSGLFAWPSLPHKGSSNFLRDRVLRLGIPFLVALLLMPLAYYSAYRARAIDPSFETFWREWLSLGFWPSGPLWFVAILLAFDAVAASVYKLIPRLLEHLNRFGSRASRRPTVFFAGLIVTSAFVYLPMQIAFGADSWVKFGPFFLQTSRLLHYGVYFFAGVAVGVGDIGHSFIARDGRLARRWLAWVLAALVLFAVDLVRIVVISPIAVENGWAPLMRHLMSGLTFVMSCAATSFAMLALFVRFTTTRISLLDSFSQNAYGVYLVHFGFVLWLQYALLQAPLAAVAKVATVFGVALVASWITIAGLRRIPMVARMI